MVDPRSYVVLHIEDEQLLRASMAALLSSLGDPAPDFSLRSPASQRREVPASGVQEQSRRGIAVEMNATVGEAR